MPFKILKTQQKELTNLADGQIDLKVALEAAQLAYNQTVEAAHEELKKAVETYNAGTKVFSEVISTLTTTFKEELIGKSDKWQETPAAAAAETFVSRWEEFGLELEAVELDDPERIEFGLPEIELPDFTA